MKKWTAVMLALLLLAGCRAPAGESSAPTPEPVSIPTEVAPSGPVLTLEPSREPATPDSPFGVLPVTEEGIWDYYLYEEKGYYIIRGITPYEGDYLVELGRDYESDNTMLVWIFGDTGRKVQMTTMESRSEMEIQSRGSLRIRTDAKNTGTAWIGPPETYQAIAPAVGDCVVTVKETTWLAPAESLRVGFWMDGEMYSERYEQLCDARVDAEGLSFSFIPNTDSMEKFQSFFPACTSTPSFETSLDETGGIFTLRLYNTSLKSGEYAREMKNWADGWDYDGLYPRAIPEGSLGEDNLFLTGVEIHQDGEDVVITAKLTDRAGWFTVDYGNLGYDDIPWLRLQFREPDSMEVEYGS